MNLIIGMLVYVYEHFIVNGVNWDLKKSYISSGCYIINV